MPEIRISSWNVNGIRSYIFNNKPSAKFKTIDAIDPESNLQQLLDESDSNVICFQKTRCGMEKMDKIKIPGWNIYHASSEGEGGRGKDRYSGVAIMIKQAFGQPEGVIVNLPTLVEPLDLNGRDREGRFIALDYGDYIIINTYVPNAGTNFTYRTQRWDQAMLEYLTSLNELGKRVIWVGDMNIARTPYDLCIGNVRTSPKGKRLLETLQTKIKSVSDSEEINKLTSETEENLQLMQLLLNETPYMKGIDEKSPAGFTFDERNDFENIINAGFTDGWRHLHPEAKFKGSTWWNLRVPSYRQLDMGWRIDYVVINNQFIDSLTECRVLNKIGEKTKLLESIKKYGSDHCPIFAVITF